MSSKAIHPTAIVHPKSELDEDVIVGPFCVIGEHVKIGRGTELRSHVKSFPTCRSGLPPSTFSTMMSRLA